MAWGFKGNLFLMEMDQLVNGGYSRIQRLERDMEENDRFEGFK